VLTFRQITKVTLKIAVERWVINLDFDPSTNFEFEPTWLYSPDDDFKSIPLDDAESDPTTVMYDKNMRLECRF
jgi:hypothetical protein